MIHFILSQYKHSCRVGFGSWHALKRAVRFYRKGFAS